MPKEKVALFWFRRDIRLEDNRGLWEALRSGSQVLPVFIFDSDILDGLEEDDARVTFIHDSLEHLSEALRTRYGSGVLCKAGTVLRVWKELLDEFDIKGVYANRDYEPYATKRDSEVERLLAESGVKLHLFKDQVVFEGGEIMKMDGSPYTVFTPYRNSWMDRVLEEHLTDYSPGSGAEFRKGSFRIPSLEELGFKRSLKRVKEYRLDGLDEYHKVRDIPYLDGTSNLSAHLRFGTVSVRSVVRSMLGNGVFVNELIWREFFMQIMYLFPQTVGNNFNSKYDFLKWRNNEAEFELWMQGETGYPLVDAGMRELKATGYMHNRVRMIAASFLCKDLLIDWRWGEAYFAGQLMDYELSSNNGNWQWAAGTGCDSAPYFRIFNPDTQLKKFDPQLSYVRRWVPEVDSKKYATKMVDHNFARIRALDAYKSAIIR